MKIYKISQRGECFKNVWKSAKDLGGSDVFICHGKVTNIEGKTYDHAWIEQGDKVIDPTQDVTIDKTRYYNLVNAQLDAKYTVEQVSINTIRSNHWGPWSKQEVDKRFVFRK